MSPIYDTLAVATESMERERGARLPCGPRANRHRAVANALLRLSGEEEWGSTGMTSKPGGSAAASATSMTSTTLIYVVGRKINAISSNDYLAICFAVLVMSMRCSIIRPRRFQLPIMLTGEPSSYGFQVWPSVEQQVPWYGI